MRLARIAAFLAPLSLVLASPAPALAYDFILVGSGNGQRLLWRWECGYPFHTCASDPTPCGDFPTVNGNVSNSHQASFRPGGFSGNSLEIMVQGGSLSWTGNDSLKVIALTGVSASAYAGSFVMSPGYSFCWAVINARDVPMTFQLLSDPGDPPTTNLRITPRLVGTFNHNTTVGGWTNAFVQYEMSVSVNGVEKTSDSLHTEWTFEEGADGSHDVSFPRGALNTVVVPNVSISSQITVKIWAYSQLYCTMSGAVETRGEIASTSAFGNGPAIAVTVQPLGVTAVGDSPEPRAFTLRTLPNPTLGRTQIQYSLPRAANVRLAIYDVTGHRVAMLMDRREIAGEGEFVWDGKSSRGEALPAGLYWVELVADRERNVRRLALLGR